ALHGVADPAHALQGGLLGPVPAPVAVVVASLPYLPELKRDGAYDDEPREAVYAPGDGLDPYRRLLDVCRDGKLVSPGGTVFIQFHREPLAADCWQLEDLREQLEAATAAA